MRSLSHSLLLSITALHQKNTNSTNNYLKVIANEQFHSIYTGSTTADNPSKPMSHDYSHFHHILHSSPVLPTISNTYLTSLICEQMSLNTIHLHNGLWNIIAILVQKVKFTFKNVTISTFLAPL